MFNDTQTNINSSSVASYRPVFSCPQSPNFVWDTTNEIFPWIMVAIVSIASPAAIILNILTIAAVKSRKELQKNSNILLSSMAVADILVGAINMPLSALVEFVISWQVFNNAICQVDLVNVYLMFAFTGCSLYHLTLIAWERYQAIGKCFEYKAKMTKRRLKKLAKTAWFLAALTSIPGIVLTALGINHDFIIEAIAAFFALILIPYFYIMVYRETRKRNCNTHHPNNFSGKSKTGKQSCYHVCIGFDSCYSFLCSLGNCWLVGRIVPSPSQPLRLSVNRDSTANELYSESTYLLLQKPSL